VGIELTDIKSPVNGTQAACAELVSKILIEMIEKTNADFIEVLRFLFIMSPIPFIYQSTVSLSNTRVAGCRYTLAPSPIIHILQWVQ
jgi:hypothetical protein